jgi:hypothetical protein
VSYYHTASALLTCCQVSLLRATHSHSGDVDGKYSGYSTLVFQQSPSTFSTQIDQQIETQCMNKTDIEYVPLKVQPYVLVHVFFIPLYIFFFALRVSDVCSVGIATGYGLDGPGIESQWG